LLPGWQTSDGRTGRIPFAEDFGRDALPDFALGTAVFEEQRIRVGMDVDESRGDDLTFGINRSRGSLGGESPDCDDAVAADGHVTDEPWIARAVDDAAVAHNQVVGGLSVGD
jgi:hypothetical protein